MNLGKISYLGELFNMFQLSLRAVSSGDLNARELMRRYRSMVKVLRQISLAAEEAADSIEKEIDQLAEIALRTAR